MYFNISNYQIKMSDHISNESAQQNITKRLLPTDDDLLQQNPIITEEVLLKNDPALKNRPYQLEALLRIFQYKKCLVKMFCGTGKSRIITNVNIHEKKELSVVVFPSLSLINQYSADYLDNVEYKHHFKKHKKMNVSSENLDTITSTTKPHEIKKFLKSKSPKIILVTYQSFQVLLDCLEGKKIGLVCYDEAHHVVSPETQKLVFGTDYYEKEVFFTATPKNENGITMFDRDDPEQNMCGPVAYDYTYLQGLVDKVLNAFEICIDMYTENTNNSIYEAMARGILSRNTNRVLSFHSGVNGESNTNVWNFVKPTEFQTAFEKVQKAEFPEKGEYYKKPTFKGMDGKTPPAERKEMLRELDDTPDNEIYIISSCETIGEGVDTKKANMCLFADPKASIVKIIQNIGRVVRRNKDHPLSTILIPCWVNMDNYAAANGDREKQDELIRQQMRSENGDYIPILNVLGALRQEDPDLYDMCLNYPNRRVKQESLSEQGLRIADEVEDEHETYSTDDVEQMKKDGEPLEIHTNETIECFNDDTSQTITRLYYDEEDVYKPIVRTDETDCEEDERLIIQPPKPKPGIKMSIHRDDDIQMLWGVKGDVDFSKKFCSVTIECDVSFRVENWYNTLKKVCEYMDREKKAPNHRDKNPEIKTLGSWVSNQKTKYKTNAWIMKTNHDVRKAWETTVEKYNEYLRDRDEDWYNTLEKVCEYMDREKKAPTSTNKNPEIKTLGGWVLRQKQHYKKNAFIMKTNPDVRKAWETTMEKYSGYLRDRDEDWYNTLEKVCEYMDREKKAPSGKDKNPEIKTLGLWVGTQKQNYKKKEGTVWTNQDVRKAWETTVEKYSEYLVTDLDEYWYNTKDILCAYMDREKKAPSGKDKNPEIKTLGLWVGTQKQNYKKKEGTVWTNQDVRKAWETTVEKYSEYLVTDLVEDWYNTLEKVCEYMDREKKAPSTIDKNPEIKKLGRWVSTQKRDEGVLRIIWTNPDVRKTWETTVKKYSEYLYDPYEKWYNTLEKVCEYMDRENKAPNHIDKNPEIKTLGSWVSNQKTNYKKKKGTVWTNPDVRKAWETTMKKYSEHLDPSSRKKKQTAIPEPSEEPKSTTPHHFPPISKIATLHKTWLKMQAETLHKLFKENPTLHSEYHAERKRNFSQYDPSSIPSTQIIQKLEKITTKRVKVVVDMGCGEAPIAHHFQKKKDTRFTFHNYDHQTGGDPSIQEVDISSLPLEDNSVEIAIMSLALWGTSENHTQYIKEAYRVLESGGKFYISDSTKRWSPEQLTPENGGELLRTLLTTNGFNIINEDIGVPFCLFECAKIY